MRPLRRSPTGWPSVWTDDVGLAVSETIDEDLSLLAVSTREPSTPLTTADTGSDVPDDRAGMFA